MPTTYSTKQTATMLQVSPNTLRNWSEQYAIYLSESARPGYQPERRFTDKDLTILTYIKQLRSEGIKEDGIKTRLGETTFTDIEILQPAANALQVDTTIDQPALPDALQSTSAAIVPHYDNTALERRLERLERSREPAFMMGFGLGVVVMGILFLLLLGLAVLYGGFR